MDVPWGYNNYGQFILWFDCGQCFINDCTALTLGVYLLTGDR